MLVLSAAACCTDFCSRNIYKITRGHFIIPQFHHLIFFHTSSFLSPRSPVHGCATRLSHELPSSFSSFLQFFTLSDCLVIFYIYFQLELLLYFSAFFNIHIFAIYLNRNIYVHTFENKHISYLLLFSIARALLLRFTIAKHLEQLFFFFGTIFVMGLSFGRRNGKIK